MSESDSASSDNIKYPVPDDVEHTKDLECITPACSRETGISLSLNNSNQNHSVSSLPPLSSLSLVDRYLTLLILLAMTIGVLIGYYSPSSADTINSWSTGSTNWPIAIGLIVMIYPPLARLDYAYVYLLVSTMFRQVYDKLTGAESKYLENKFHITQSISQIKTENASPNQDITENHSSSLSFLDTTYAPQAISTPNAIGTGAAPYSLLQLLGFSIFVNWVIGPLLMFFLAVACLPDQPDYIRGLILVGIARCIAMVIIWNGMAGGHAEFAAILVGVNSLFQILMYSVYAYIFVSQFLPALNLPSMQGESSSSNNVNVSFLIMLESVLIYLGIPFVLGLFSWLIIPHFTGRDWYKKVYTPFVAPLTLIALLFTIIILFILRGHTIVTLPTDILRIIVPLLIYFTVVFILTFLTCYYMHLSYPDTVTLSFTAASNNFELAIAVSIAAFGLNTGETLATVVGPLVEVPVMLLLVWIARSWRGWFRADLLESHMDMQRKNL